MDFIDYSNFSISGVTVSDTFDIWRQKTNGTITRLNSIIADVNTLYNADRSAIRYVTVDTPQNITSTKTFSGGTLSSPVLKIDTSGLYYDSSDATLASTTALKSAKLVNSGAQIQLGAITYSVPTNNPSELSLLSKNGAQTSWTGYSTLVSQIKNEASVNVVTTNIVSPVGTIQAYISDTGIPDGWLLCTGGRFLGSSYPQLATLLLNRYGPVYTSETGTTFASNQASYVATNWYVLPNMQGRIAVGAGTANDGTNAAQTFTLGGSGGKFAHTLITAELPSHTHSMDSVPAHTHSVIQTIDNNGAFVSGSGIPRYGLANAASGSAGAHTHTINSTGSDTAHTIMQPYLVTNYIIKAKPDNVITSQILVGSGINVVRTGSSQSFISLTDSADSTLSVNHDSTLRINTADSSLGLNSNSVNNSNLVNGAVSPEKLSTNGPSWGLEGSETALYEGSGSSRNRVATRKWVEGIIVDGPVKSLVTKNPGQRHTSAATLFDEHIYAYIDKDGVPNMAGAHEFGAIAPNNLVVGYTPYPLPLDNGIEITAEKLWIGKERILALGSNGKLYGRGRDARNDFNNINPVVGDNRYSNWVLAFTAVYSYLGQSRTIKSVIISPDEWDTNIAVIDSADALWISGDNQYGQLATGNQLQTNQTVPGSYHATPALTDVKEAVMIGTWNGVAHPVTVAAIQWTSSAKTSATVRTVGYGGLGQMGDGTSIDVNTSWKTAAPFPSGAPNPVNCGLYVSGSEQYSSIYLVANDGSVAYGWGYNDDRGLGTDPRQSAITLPIKIWDATTNGPPAQRGREIEKFYTTSHIQGWTSTYILTKPLDSGKREIWAAGVNNFNKWGTATGNDTGNLWTNITPSGRPANWSIDNFYVGNSYNQATNNFIRWKIDNSGGDVYQLEASGWSGEYSTGTGLNSGPLTTWTRVNLRSEIVKTIIDCQNGRTGKQYQAFTYLLCNDGSLYYCGQSRYASIPFGVNGYYTSNFIRIK
jgi:microcystin-dependent protein